MENLHETEIIFVAVQALHFQKETSILPFYVHQLDARIEMLESLPETQLTSILERVVCKYHRPGGRLVRLTDTQYPKSRECVR